MKKNIGWYAAGLLALAMVARASVIVYNALLVNETALAYNNTYVVDLQNSGINALSAQATYSSATVANVSFGDGAQATGSFTVLSYAGLIAAKASNNITVSNNSALARASLILPGFVLQEGIDWRVRDTSSGTAASLATALGQVPFLSVSRAGSVVFTTATVAGTRYNATQMASSTQAALSVATPFFTGGQDNASAAINGVVLLQGRDFTAATSNAATATSLKNAINANALLSKIRASASGALVTSTSTLAGAKYNYALVSSTPAALSASGANMTGGLTPADTLGSAVIAAPSHGLTLALPLLYNAPVGVIGGLSDQTTYYAIVVDANSIKLASSKSNALLGTGIVATSTSTQIAAHTFTLAPLAIGGVPSFKWQASNDNVSWVDLAVSSVSLTSYSNPAASTIWSFGYIGTRFLRLNVVAPTTGGLGLNVRVIGTN